MNFPSPPPGTQAIAREALSVHWTEDHGVLVAHEGAWLPCDPNLFTDAFEQSVDGRRVATPSQAHIPRPAEGLSPPLTQRQVIAPDDCPDDALLTPGRGFYTFRLEGPAPALNQDGVIPPTPHPHHGLSAPQALPRLGRPPALDKPWRPTQTRSEAPAVPQGVRRLHVPTPGPARPTARTAPPEARDQTLHALHALTNPSTGEQSSGREALRTRILSLGCSISNFALDLQLPCTVIRQALRGDPIPWVYADYIYRRTGIALIYQ